jgi:signal transduction histidine kinase
MSLRAKLFSALTALALAPLILFGVIAYLVSSNSLNQVEQNSLRSGIESTDRALKLIEQNLAHGLIDYTDYDEMHAQVLKPAIDPDFINGNFSPDTAVSAYGVYNLNAIGVWNKAGQLLYVTGPANTLGQNLGAQLLQALTIEQPQTMLISLNKMIYLVSIGSIRTSDGKDPNGVILFARAFGTTDVEQIKALTGADLALYIDDQMVASTTQATVTPAFADLKRAAGGQQVFNLSNADTALALQPLLDNAGKQIGTLVVTESRAAITAAQNSSIAIMIPVFILTALLSILVALWLRNSISQPLQAMALSADKIAGGDLAERVEKAVVRDELSQLADAFNRMAEKLAVRVELSESENTRLKSVDEYRLNIMTSISTALQQPLSAIQLHAQTLRMEMYGALNEPQRASLQEIKQAVEAQQALLDKLIDLAQAQQKQLKMRHETFTLENVVTVATRQVKKRYAGKYIELQTDLPLTLPPLAGDLTRTTQVFEDLLTWAFESSVARGIVQLRAVVGKNDVNVALITTGHPLGTSEQGSFFDLFPTSTDSQTAERSAVGNGLGRAFAKALIEQQGGHIAVQPTVTGNAINFNILLDAAAAAL